MTQKTLDEQTLSAEQEECEAELHHLRTLGYKTIGVSRWGRAFLYLKKDDQKVAGVFSTKDPSFNHPKKKSF